MDKSSSATYNVFYTVMVWKGIQVKRGQGNIRKRTKKKPWRKRPSRSWRFSSHKYFTTFFYLFLFSITFQSFFSILFLPTTFTHTHTHDPRLLPTTHDSRHLATLDSMNTLTLYLLVEESEIVRLVGGTYTSYSQGKVEWKSSFNLVCKGCRLLMSVKGTDVRL